jgi:hypothetical protein
MAVNAISMRRAILGEGSFVESLVGRVLLLVLYTTLVGGILVLIFVVNQVWAPQLVKYGVLAATGVAAGFGARRLLVGRTIYVKIGAAVFALAIALSVLNVLSLGYVGLNLLRAYPSNPEWDGMLQLAFCSFLAWVTLRAWAATSREVLVEPRYSPAPVVPAQSLRSTRSSRPNRTRRATASSIRRSRRTIERSSNNSLGAAFSAWTSQLATQFSGLLSSPSGSTATRRRKTAKKSTKSKTARQRFIRRAPAVYLSSEVEHRCPYCLEEVRRNDSRGVKICKVCKTWHHADCWAITGVCQVPHEYVN